MHGQVILVSATEYGYSAEGSAQVDSSTNIDHVLAASLGLHHCGVGASALHVAMPTYGILPIPKSLAGHGNHRERWLRV